MADKKKDDATFEASQSTLASITSAAAGNHAADPKTTLHRPADHSSSSSWLWRYFPSDYLDSLEAEWHMGNYVLDRQTNAKTFEAMSIYVRVGMHLLYYGTEQEKALHWSRTVALLEAETRKMGAAYDSAASAAQIRPFIDSFSLHDTLPTLKQPDPDAYKTFNDFFAREILPSARPVDAPGSATVVSCPADCRLTAFPTVDLATKYWIKGFGFTLSRLLGSSELAQKFDGGGIVIARLAPQDYHRWHAPVSGVVESVREMPGAYYTVNPQAINEPGTLDVFCENRRSVMVLSRAVTGAPVAIVAVGAMLVGSVFYVEGVGKEGAKIERGMCLGGFRYGGSTVVVVFPKGEVVLDGDLVRNSTERGLETLMRVGWRIGEGPVEKA